MLFIEEGKDYDEVVKSELPYKLLENLGHGSSGFVEKVKDRSTSHLFARKIIRRPHGRAVREKQTTVFRNEVKNIRRLGNHRHIISLFATYTTEDEFGLILQPVASDKDLAQYLAKYRSALLANDASFPNPRLQDMTTVLEQAFGCLISGMAYMHKKKVRHKDVKLQNILIHEGQVVYTDFGISFDSNGRSRSRTEGRPGPMTAKYSAPEVLASEPRDSSSDIYSLGCVFISILSALTSASAPDVQEILSFADSMDAIHQQIADWQTNSRTAVLPAIITRMTKRDPSKRLCAIHLAGEIFRLPGLSCQECAAHSIDPKSECVKTETCAEGFYSPGETQIVQASDNSTNPNEGPTGASRQACSPSMTKASMRCPDTGLLPGLVPSPRKLPSYEPEQFLVPNDEPILAQDTITAATIVAPSSKAFTEAATTVTQDNSLSGIARGTRPFHTYPLLMDSWPTPNQPYTLLPVPRSGQSPLRRVATFPTTQYHYSFVLLASVNYCNFEPGLSSLHAMENGVGLSNIVQEPVLLSNILELPQISVNAPRILLLRENTLSQYM
jgi:serine/threonine protein kinase